MKSTNNKSLYIKMFFCMIQFVIVEISHTHESFNLIPISSYFPIIISFQNYGNNPAWHNISFLLSIWLFNNLLSSI